MPSAEQVAPFTAVAVMPEPSIPVSTVAEESLQPRKSSSWSGPRTHEAEPLLPLNMLEVVAPAGMLQQRYFEKAVAPSNKKVKI
jgi:hypothetical protein